MIILGGVRDGYSRVELHVKSIALDATKQHELKIIPPLQQVGGTCYAYAVARLAELAGFDSPSPEWINFCARMLDARSENADLRFEGSYAKSAIAGVVHYGICTYQYHRDMRRPPDLVARISAARSKGSFHAIDTKIAPCVITNYVYENVYTYNHGSSPELDVGDGNIGSHVWVYLGDDEQGRHVVQSSWGAWGGPMGVCYMSDRYLKSSWDCWGLRYEKK